MANRDRPMMRDDDERTDAFLLGAHLVTPRLGYMHHGIYAGAGMVVHYSGLSGFNFAGCVEEVTIDVFAAGRAVGVHPELGPVYAAARIVERARSRIGEHRYRLISNNCEHFCSWCVRGESRSAQVERLLRLLGAVKRRLLAARLVLARVAAADALPGRPGGTPRAGALRSAPSREACRPLSARLSTE